MLPRVPLLCHLPNVLTASRGLAGPVILALVVGAGLDEAAFVLFLLAVLTDLLDGWLARRLGAESRLGSLLDPVADKMLVDGTWLAIGLSGWAPWWLVGPVLFRDLAVSIGFFATGARKHDPNMLGRLMVSVEGVALPILLFRNPWLDVHWPTIGIVLGMTSLALAAASALAYLADLARRGASPDADGVLRGRPCPRPPSTPT